MRHDVFRQSFRTIIRGGEKATDAVKTVNAGTELPKPFQMELAASGGLAENRAAICRSLVRQQFNNQIPVRKVEAKQRLQPSSAARAYTADASPQ